jgi:hypothetical protein
MGQGSQALQGAAGGAMSGAAFGSAIPGIGTAIGAGVGGILGGLGGYFGGGGQADYQSQLDKLAAGYGKRQAPQAGAAAQGQNSQFRANQAGLIAQLEAMARGEGPSAASMMMREAMDRAAGSQASAAAGAGGRGVNAGAAFRQATNNTAAIQSQGARDAGLMRVNEQLGAVSQLGQTIAQGRAGDENMSQFNAGQQNNQSLANLQAQLQTLGLNDRAQLQALMQAMGAAGPGMGTQLLAGGANAVPGLLQYAQAQKAAPVPGVSQGGGIPQQYIRNADCTPQGPVTSPYQTY